MAGGRGEGKEEEGGRKEGGRKERVCTDSYTFLICSVSGNNVNG